MAQNPFKACGLETGKHIRENMVIMRLNVCHYRPIYFQLIIKLMQTTNQSQLNCKFKSRNSHLISFFNLSKKSQNIIVAC